MGKEQRKLTSSEFIDVLVALRLTAGNYDTLAENARSRGDGDAMERNMVEASRYRATYDMLANMDYLTATHIN